MESDRFDALTRTLTSAGSSRRQALRALGSVLLGGALDSVATGLGWTEDAEGKAKKHQKAKSKRQSKVGTEHREHRQFQAEGKHKGKGKKGSHHHNPPQNPPPLSPLPPGCQNCNACQMCQDGACVPDPALGGVPCEGSGPHCNYCLLGECVATDDRPCDDGFCPHRGTCCPGEKYCPDHSGPPGYACVGQDDCCPGLKKCPDGECIPSSACCQSAPKPLCNDFCAPLGCRDGEWKCVPHPDGTACLRPAGGDGKCCQGVCSMEEIICPAYPWRQYNPQTCRCECKDGLVDCPGGYQNRPCCEGF